MMPSKLPAGYYALGVCINPMPDAGHYCYPPKAWSVNGFTLFKEPDAKSFRFIADRPTRVDTVHAWGMCRLVDVRIDATRYKPEDGALFVHVGQVMSAGSYLDVVIESVCVE